MEKILVLGSNSFAGATFCNFALSKNFNVIGINRSPETSDIFLPALKNVNNHNYKFIRADLNKDLDLIIETIDRFKPEYIVDFAGQGMVAESWDNPDQWYETNIVAKSKIHKYLIDKTFLKKYIRISTPEVYGSNDDLIDESFSMNPSTPYAISHMATDLSILALYKNFHFPAVIGRFANFYGPHQQLYRIIPKTIISILTNQTLSLHGGGKSIRAFIHADDVSSGIFRMLSLGVAGQVYHFSPKDFFSIKEIVQMICDELDADFTKSVIETPDRKGKDFAYLMNSSKSLNKLQWAPKISLKDGIKETVAWVQNNIDIINELSLEYEHKE
jgi:dTDP-glucose 4,6-dehydratase